MGARPLRRLGRDTSSGTRKYFPVTLVLVTQVCKDGGGKGLGLMTSGVAAVKAPFAAGRVILVPGVRIAFAGPRICGERVTLRGEES